MDRFDLLGVIQGFTTEVQHLATTRLIPLHTGKGRKTGQAIRGTIEYVMNPGKTERGEFITSYACDHRTADLEFMLSKREYIAKTGRIRGKDDVIAYHLRQSFVPEEITPQEANRLGQELARRWDAEAMWLEPDGTYHYTPGFSARIRT